MKKTPCCVWAMLLVGAGVSSSPAELISIPIVDVFSYDLLGAIPPNETRVVDVAGQLGMSGVPYDVVGLGWEVTIDAFIPSWLSDASIAFGSNPTFEFPDFVLVPGQGDDFGALMTYRSNGIRDLTNWEGRDLSFKLPLGVAYLEFFESYDDYPTIPDAWYRSPSVLTLEVVRLPEPVTNCLVVGGCLLFGLRRRARGSARSMG